MDLKLCVAILSGKIRRNRGAEHSILAFIYAWRGGSSGSVTHRSLNIQSLPLFSLKLLCVMMAEEKVWGNKRRSQTHRPLNIQSRPCSLSQVSVCDDTPREAFREQGSLHAESLPSLT